MRLPLFEACHAVLAHIRGKYPAPGLHADIAEKKQTAQLNGLFREDGQQGMMKGRTHDAIETVFSFAAPFVDRSLGFVEWCNLTRRNVIYTEMVNYFLSDHSETACTAEELASLRSEISRVKTVVGRPFAPHCSSGLFALRFHLLNHVMESLGRSGCLSSTNAAPFECCSVPIKKGYRMTARQYSKRTYETVHNISEAPEKVGRRESQASGGVFGATLLEKKKCVEDGGGVLCEMRCACPWSSWQRQLRERKRRLL